MTVSFSSVRRDKAYVEYDSPPHFVVEYWGTEYSTQFSYPIPMYEFDEEGLERAFPGYRVFKAKGEPRRWYLFGSMGLLDYVDPRFGGGETPPSVLGGWFGEPPQRASIQPFDYVELIEFELKPKESFYERLKEVSKVSLKGKQIDRVLGKEWWNKTPIRNAKLLYELL
jgi:hypothetical protein